MKMEGSTLIWRIESELKLDTFNRFRQYIIIQLFELTMRPINILSHNSICTLRIAVFKIVILFIVEIAVCKIAKS